MKKITLEYLAAIEKFALNENTTKLILSELSIETYDTPLTYEENEYLISFRKTKIGSSFEWRVISIIPSPTLDELNDMDRLAQNKLATIFTQDDSFKVQIDYDGNRFETEYKKKENGDYVRGYFHLKFGV